LTARATCAILKPSKGRKTDRTKKGDPPMFRDYFEVHEAEWEAMESYLREEEEKVQMDEDYLASGGHLWD
jgi:hypothetical protein